MTAVFDAALRYVRRGFSVIPCVGKRTPLTRWTPFMTSIATETQIRRWAQAGVLQNVALICGRVSGNLVVIDLDGDEAVEVFSDRFPHLMDTYVVRSGSGHGAHVYLRSWGLPTTLRALKLPVGNIELRADGHYVVAPPSVHPDSGNPYTVINRKPILSLHNLDEVQTWIQAKKDANRPPTKPTELQPAIRKPGGEATDPEVIAWRKARAALRHETEAVRTAPAGARNHTLNRAAYKLGQLVGAGKLNQSEVETVLLAAADSLARDDGERSVEKTIRSGLNAGIANPRG